MKKQKTIFIYHNNICQIGGVETFLYNWCLNLRNYYDITVLYSIADKDQLRRIKKLVKTEVYDKDKEYVCDIFIRNSVWGHIPTNIVSKDNRYIEMRHANYKFLQDKGKLNNQYHKMKEVNEIVGCGQFVSQMSRLVLNDNPTTIKNILAPKQETNKILKLISCTRIDSEKGWDRMEKMMSMLKGANIKFEWKIFTNSNKKTNYEEVHFYKQRFDIWDYLVDADYTVLLSDSEGLPYTIQESLQYRTPCIVTDVGGCTELIQDGINGYVVPLNMEFDINKILNIPKCEEYDNHALEKWIEYLRNAVYIEKEDLIMDFKVKATDKFRKDNVKDKDVNRIREEGEIWIVDEERKDLLVEKGFAVIVEETKEIKKDTKEEKPKKKTTKKGK